MTTIPSRLLYATFLLITSTLMSCGAYSTMQTARTVEEKHGEISLNLFSPRGFIDAITQVVDKDHDNYFTLPYIQVSGKYGITDQIDAGINLNTYGQMGLEGKYMLVGDHNSLFSLSPGLSFNTFFFYFYDFQIPLHASVHPLPNLGIYLTPRYIGQFVGLFGLENESYFDYASISTGIMYGDRIKFGLDITAAFPLGKFYRVDIFPNIYNFGVGVKWTIGKSKDNSNPGKKIRF
ncbi:MAG TPA: hypothetical protein PKY97_08610 [Saprospiraceae bacterium]|nr:hypothetical protein [Saprospiraceae bacterium]